MQATSLKTRHPPARLMQGPMEGRVVLITGANSGVGKEAARGLARMGARVVLACRNVRSGEAARDEIAADTGNDGLDVMKLDLASFRDIRRFASEFLAEYDALHVLVNNAGFHTSERVVTEDGFESTFAVCHLGHFLLTDLLLERLKQSAPARVVTVASQAHLMGTLRFDDLMGERSWNGTRAYSQAKLANIVFANELGRRLEGTGVTSNSVHPGSARTGWARGDESGLLRFLVKATTPFMISAEKGALTTIHVASAPELADVTSTYFRRSKPARPSREARDPEVAKRLWTVSEGFTRA